MPAKPEAAAEKPAEAGAPADQTGEGAKETKDTKDTKDAAPPAG